MDTAVIVLVLAVALLAIIALPQFVRREPREENLAPPLPVNPPRNTPKLVSADEIDGKPFARWLTDQACRQTGINLRQDPMALTRLAEAAAKAQNELNDAEEADVNLPYIAADGSGPRHFRITVKRSDLNPLGHRMV